MTDSDVLEVMGWKDVTMLYGSRGIGTGPESTYEILSCRPDTVPILVSHTATAYQSTRAARYDKF